jgi:acetyltransferase-like isoleucine patch superfamily enzyme
MNIDSLTGAWDYAELPANVRIGDDCWLERKSSFGSFRSERNPGLVLGDRVRVYTWATFNIEPAGCVEIGDDSVLVGPVFMCSAQITVGRRVLISYNVTIADADFHPVDPELRKQDAIANAPFGDRSRRPPFVSRPVIIGDDVWIGIGAIVLKGVRVGHGARIGPGTVVTRDVPAGCAVAGNPARPMAAEEFQA